MTGSSYATGTESETEAVGEELASALGPEDVVFLSGKLGAGKTCLARGIARGLGASPRQVASPTFALLHEYADDSGRIVLRHLDLYRLEDEPRALEVLGIPEALAGAPVVVEWPGQALARVLPPTVEIAIEADVAGERRSIEVRRPAPATPPGAGTPRTRRGARP